jgi:hypothetical protein
MNRILELAGVLNEANKIVEPKKFAKELADAPLDKKEALKKIADDSGLEDVLGTDKDWKKFEKALKSAYEAGMKSNDE